MKLLALLVTTGCQGANLGTCIQRTQNHRSLIGMNLIKFNIDELRDVWFKTLISWTPNNGPLAHAEKRYQNYKKQILNMTSHPRFDGNIQDVWY